MTIGVDAPRVDNEAEAFTLMVHHLRLAAMYFEATLNPLPDFAGDEFSKPAMTTWAASMAALYED